MISITSSVRLAHAVVVFAAVAIALPSHGASVAVGGHHVYVLKSDGRVWSWGYNSSGGTQAGALGDGTAIDRSTPVLISALSSVSRVDAGQDHGIALRTDGTVWTWGGGAWGQIGNGKTNDQLTPAAVTTLSGVAAIAAGQNTCFAVKTDGTVWSWGDNRNGELGLGSTATQTKPVKITALTGIKTVSAGPDFAVALGVDGRVWSWGANRNGQLGSGSTAARTTPGQVLGLPSIVELRAGTDFCLALDSQGIVWTWGVRTALGDGTSAPYRTTPAAVTVLPPIRSVYAGSMGTVAIAAAVSGDVYTWGSNYNGQAQPPAGADILLPRVYPALAGAVSVASSTTSAAILADGRVRTWGMPARDYRGGDATTPLGSTLLLESTRTGFSRLAVGTNYTLGIDGAGQLWVRGANDSGQLGIGSKSPYRAFTPVTGLGSVNQARVANAGSGALSSDGKLWFWGSNYSGRFGDGTIASRTSPAAVPSLPAAKGFDLAYSHAVAVLTNGDVWSWGGTGYGQTGTAPTPTGYNAVPTKVAGVSGATAVAAARSHSLALLSNGTVMWWGTAAGVASYTPTLVSRLAGVTKITAGDEFSVALLSDGTVSTWGINSSGQLGNGSTMTSTRPVTVTGLTGIVDVSAGDAHVIALRNDGSAWRWGDGILSPVRIGTLTGIKAISGSGALGIVTADGRISSYASYGNVLDGLLRQVADFRAIPSTDDSDSDGLPDSWEMLKFGTLLKTAAADDDADGLSNVQEFILGSEPRSNDSDVDGIPDWADVLPWDFYNSEKPTVSILAGNNQNAPPGQFAPIGLEIAVWDPRGLMPLAGAPVTFAVVQGGGVLSAATSGAPLVSSAALAADVDGTAKLYYREPSSQNVTSDIQVTAGTVQVHFVSTSGFIDTNANGLPDSWEVQYFGSVGADPTADPDGDGLSNLTEYQQGTSPVDYYNGIPPQITSLVSGAQPGALGIVSVRLNKSPSGVLLANAPVTFTLTSGANPFSPSPGGISVRETTVRTDAQGVASIYVEGWFLIVAETIAVKPATGDNPAPLILSLNPPASSDGDGNGLPDWWEVKYFGQTGVNPSADTDGDGVSARLEFERATSPTNPDAAVNAAAALRVFSPLNR